MEIDWVKAIAIAGSTFYGMEKMMKVFRLWKVAQHKEISDMGLTVKNGEYRSLLKTLGRIEGRIDHVVSRVDSIESRMST